MDAIAVLHQDIAPAAEINTALFYDFVSFVDRSEKTTRTYLNNLKQFMAWLKYAEIRCPLRQDIISYRQWLMTEHAAISFAPETAEGYTTRRDSSGNPLMITCKPTTVKGYLQAVKAFFAWAAANNLYPNVAANIHAPKISDNHKKDSLTAEEVLTIEQSITQKVQEVTAAAAEAVKDRAGRIQRSTEQGKRLYAMYLLAVNAGLRTIEISRANIKDLETKGGKTYLYIWGKGHSAPDQKKPIAAEVKAAIDDYIAARTDAPTGSSPLFVSTGNRSKGKRIASTTISTMLKRAMQDAGFDSDRITAHSLRHSTAANVMELTGNNIYAAQQYLRHSSPKTTEVYLENDTIAQDAILAQQLYNQYHGKTDTDKRSQLESALTMLSPEQIAQLASIAAAMAK